MPLYIRDETANALVLTIDNNGNMAFADGTPIDRLSLAGYGIIDSEGYIVHGLGSGTAAPASGSVTCHLNSDVYVATIGGRAPVAQQDTTASAKMYSLEYSLPPSDPNYQDSGFISETDLQAPNVDLLADINAFGGFFLRNMNQVNDSAILDPSSQYYRSDLANGISCTYRWL
jgi:hypothetical protein